MSQTLAEVIVAARALSRSERAEVAHELIATLETASETDETHNAEFKAAVEIGLDQLDTDNGIEVPTDSLAEFVRGLGEIATERAMQR